jgi:hypothetical protein
MSDAPSWADVTVAVSTVVLTAFTGVLGWVAIIQAKLLERTTADSAIATETARQSAEAATKSAEVAERTLILAQRARVSVERPSVRYYPTDPTQPPHKFAEISIAWGNKGVTPTVGLRITTAIRLDPNPPPADFDWNSHLNEGGQTIVYPGGEARSGDHVISNLQFDALKAGTSYIHYFGRARYGDVFDKDAGHETAFCFELKPIETPIAGQEHIRLETHFFGPFNFAT